jgi:hypothetical protein
LEKVLAKFRKFEEIQVWQKAYNVTLLIYKATNEGSFAKDFGLSKWTELFLTKTALK